MDAALGWIGQIVAWFGQFIPRQVIVDSTSGAIAWINPLRFPFADPALYPQRIRVYGPGRWWYWPWTTQLEVWPTARTTRDLPAQDITSADGRVFNVAAVLTFEVEDLEKLVAHAEDGIDAIRDACSVAVYDVLHELTAEELLSRDLRRKLKGAATTALRPYGVKVLEFGLRSCTPTRVLRIVQNPPPTDGI